MNYSITVKNNKINILLSIFITSALLLSSLGISSSAFAQANFVLIAKNTANQAIDQAQSNTQNALCLSGTLTGPACNNTSTQGQANSGSNTAGQSAACRLGICS